jgi:hypothetical protein
MKKIIVILTFFLLGIIGTFIFITSNRNTNNYDNKHAKVNSFNDSQTQSAIVPRAEPTISSSVSKQTVLSNRTSKNIPPAPPIEPSYKPELPKKSDIFPKKQWWFF